MEPEAFDKDFLAMIDKETGKTVAGFADWTKQVRELNQLAKDGKNDEVIAKGPRDRRPLSGLCGSRQRLFLRRGSLPEERRQGLRDRGTGALFEDRRARSRTRSRSTRSCSHDAGKPKEAAAALERLNFIFPHGCRTA